MHDKSGTSISIKVKQVDKPAYKTREERAIEQRDRLLDKIDYAQDCLEADMNSECAKKFLRSCWKWIESKDDLPDHLIEVKRVLTQIIRDIGAEDENSNME